MTKITTVLLGLSACLALQAAATGCGSNCAETLTCGPPKDGSEAGGAGGDATSAGGASNTSTGGASTTSAGGNSSSSAGGMGGSAEGGGGATGGGGAAPIVPVSVRGGSALTCATLSDGTARCWGSNTAGQLADGTTVSSTIPVLVSLIDVVEIDPGYNHSCALKNDGTVWCVGANYAGQLGNGTNENSTSPVQVIGINSALDISVDGNASCALLADGTARCWGAGTEGQLGNGSTSNSNVPVVFGASNLAQIACGNATTCGRLTTGGVRCSGLGNTGQLGNGGTNDSPVPVVVSGISDAVDLATSSSHSCVVRSTGKVSCWGQDSFGAIGDGTAGSFHATPVDVVSISGAVDVAVAGFHGSCAVLNDGSVRCWGKNHYGQLGNGTTTGPTTANPTPVQVLGLTNATQVGFGGGHVCAVTSADQVWCWGSNYAGQLGNGNMTDSSQPLMVGGL